MRLCGFTLAAGERRRVRLPVPGGGSLDAWLLRGSRPGKTLAVTAGVHGCEYNGILALRRLAESLDCDKLCGQLILLPLVNAGGFYAGVKQLNPADGKNLNREFPGCENGTETQRIAWMIEQTIYPEADFLLDIHGGDWNEELTPLVFFPCGAGEKIQRETRKAAKVLAVSLRVSSTSTNGLYSLAAQRGIPALLLERGGNGRWTEAEVKADCEDVLRLMQHLGMIEHPFAAAAQTEIGKAVYEEAMGAGCWFPAVRAGQKIAENTLLGRWESTDGSESHKLYAKYAGIVLYETTALGVDQGDPLIAYGTELQTLPRCT